jgi:hypothetical protein
VSGPEITVVGVIADAKFAAVGEVTTRRAYLPLKQRYRDWETLVVHTRDTPARTLSRLREVIAAIDPSLPPFGAMTTEQAVANGFAASRSGVAVPEASTPRTADCVDRPLRRGGEASPSARAR